MPGKLLDVPQRTAGRNDVLRATSDERAPAAVPGGASEPERLVKPMKPNLDSAGRHADVPLGMDDALAGLRSVAGCLQSNESGPQFTVRPPLLPLLAPFDRCRASPTSPSASVTMPHVGQCPWSEGGGSPSLSAGHWVKPGACNF